MTDFSRMFSVLFVLTAVVLFPGITAAQAPPAKGWTQIDITNHGKGMTSPYKGPSGTVEIDLYLYNIKTGKYEKVTVEVEVKKDTSPADMAKALFEKLKKLICQADGEGGDYWFYLEYYDNSITIWPTDATQDPDGEGNPKRVRPEGADDDFCVRKETHPIKPPKPPDDDSDNDGGDDE